MKLFRTLACIALIVFLLFSPAVLVSRSQDRFIDARFIRKEPEYRGSIVLYHIVRLRPYAGSLTQWLKNRAEAYEKKHKGTYIDIEGMDEEHFCERLEGGRVPDAYSFFSGSLYSDRLQCVNEPDIILKDGLFIADRAIPYCYSGYCKLIRTPDVGGQKICCTDDVLAAYAEVGKNEAGEDQADILYTDLRKAGDMIRYRDGFALASLQPIDDFTDAVCWLGIDRDADPKKAEAISDFFAFLLEPEQQQSLNALGLLSVRNDIRDTPPDASMKQIFKTYATVTTVDPFMWYASYDALREDAGKARQGDTDAQNRFTKRLQELQR